VDSELTIGWCTQPANSQLILQSSMKTLGVSRLSSASCLNFLTKTPASGTVKELPGYPVQNSPSAYTCLLVSYRRLSAQFQFSLSAVTLEYLSQCSFQSSFPPVSHSFFSLPRDTKPKITTATEPSCSVFMRKKKKILCAPFSPPKVSLVVNQ
jgi:hypothetical protein